MTDGPAAIETKRREGSRLEVDDPTFCKRCGTSLPEMCVREGWHPLGGDEPPEFCGPCLAKVMFDDHASPQESRSE